MSFLQAMTAPDTTKKGVNGASVYTEAGVEDGRVALFTMLNRGLDKEYLQDAIRKLFAESETHVTQQYQLDLFLMVFQTNHQYKNLLITTALHMMKLHSCLSLFKNLELS